jgi:hypothetical protein
VCVVFASVCSLVCPSGRWWFPPASASSSCPPLHRPPVITGDSEVDLTLARHKQLTRALIHRQIGSTPARRLSIPPHTHTHSDETLTPRNESSPA